MNFKINRNGQIESLQFKRVGFLKPKEIWLGDELLGTWPKRKELEKGIVYTAKDGSRLELKMKAFPIELQIKFNDQIVEGSASHPETRIKTAYAIMAFICGLNLVVGAIAVVANVDILLRLGLGAYNLIVGSILLILLMVGFREKKFWPLATGLLLFSLDAVMMLYQMQNTNTAPNVSPIFMRIFIFIPWFKGCIDLYKKKIENKKSLQ